MKKLLLIAGIITSGAAFAQENDLETFRDKLKKLQPLPPASSLITPLVGTYSHTLPNGNKVFTLGGDNMPCIVPAPQNYSMPNIAGPKDEIVPPQQPGHIPNPGAKWKIIPIVNKR